MPRSIQKEAPAKSKLGAQPARKRTRVNGAERLKEATSEPEHGGQKDRLIGAMIDLCAEAGYLPVSVADVSARAGVSSKTFYEIFQDKEDCLLAAYRAAASRLLANLEPVGEEGDWRDAARLVLEQLLLAVEAEPAAARLLLVEALAGGARVRAERERVLGAFEQRAQGFLDSAPRDGKTLDLPSVALIGAVRSLVSRQLRTNAEDRLPPLVEDLLTWLESYSLPASNKRWSTGTRSRLPASASRRGAASAGTVQAAPERLPRGRHRLPAGVIARSHRTRIVQGTAEVVMAKGYAETTVSEIVSAAGISREVFYAHFANKQHAYLAVQRYGTQHVLESCTAAYFRRNTWPERVWGALDELIGLLVANPALAHLRLVECYAAGPEAIEQTEQLKRAATIFLQEGFNSVPRPKTVPPLATHAIAGAIFEIFYAHISQGELDQLRRSLPLLTYIANAPFLGPKRAISAIERMREEAISSRRG
jgi:AcrR family transcriptional regulator